MTPTYALNTADSELALALAEIRRLQALLAELNVENVELKTQIAALKDDIESMTWEHMEETEMMAE